MIRFLDILLASIGIFVLAPIYLLLLLVGLMDTGSPLFIQKRIGRLQQPFFLLKFRTMRTDTASVATHLADPSAITAFGKFLRRTKLDELPQLWNVLRGEMSLVGPRPCLPIQTELIEARAALGVFAARPGVTGLAQIRGVDMSTPALLAKTDAEMLRSLNLSLYLGLILQTIFGRGGGDRVQPIKKR